MSSDNQATPTTDNEAPKEANGTPAVEPSSSSSNAIDVHALKERIIATNKLFKYLSDAKNGTFFKHMKALHTDRLLQ